MTLANRLAQAAGRLAPIRRQFYALGDWTPETAAYVRQYSLDLGSIAAHAGLFAVALARFSGHNSGDRVFWFDRNGEPSAVIEALRADGHDVADLIAWPLDDPARYATAIGEADLLGAWQAWQHGNAPLRVHLTPLAWLRAKCEGCVPINPTWAGYWLDKAGGPFLTDTVQAGREVRSLLGGAAGRHRILVHQEAA